jgi:hypothetical protein
MGTACAIDLHHSRASPPHKLTLAAATALTLAAAIPATAAEAQVYRCEGRDGAIEFRQAPCPADSQGTQLIIEDHPIGWTPAPAGSQAGKRGDPPNKPRSKARRHHSGPSARERKAEECRKKRERVEDINRKLRQGTTGRQSADLRHKRRRLESFLYDECD